jgi:hypothetical protein
MNPLIAELLKSMGISFAGDQIMERTGLGKRAEGILDKIIPPAAASDASTIPQDLIPADRVMTPAEEQQVMHNADMYNGVPYRENGEPVGANAMLPDSAREAQVTQMRPTQLPDISMPGTAEDNANKVQDFVRNAAVGTQQLLKEVPEEVRADPKAQQGAAALSSAYLLKAKAMADAERQQMTGEAPKQEEVADKETDNVLSKMFGSEEFMLSLALGFNSMRLNPDQGLAQVLGKRLELLNTRKSANRTAAALRAKGTPAAIKAAEYIEQTGDAKGGIKMAMEADQYVTGSGKEMEEQFGIKGLVANQPYRYNKLTKKVEGVGGGATNIYAVKPDKGYMLVPDAESGGVKQVPIPGGPAEEALKEREAGKETMTDIITDAANSIRDAMSGGLLPETGTIGSLLSYIGETDAAEVRRQVGVLTSQAQVETLNSMRRQSPTGGALGSVTERELKMLSDKAGVIDPRADAKKFLAAVDDYQRTLYRIVHGREAGDKIFEAEMAKYGQSSQPRAATNGVTKAEDYFK